MAVVFELVVNFGRNAEGVERAGSHLQISRRRSRPVRSHPGQSDRPLAVLVAVCVLAVSLAACTSGNLQADAASGWRWVDLSDATATSFAWVVGDSVVVETELDSDFSAVRVDWDGSVEPVRFPPGDAPLLGLVPSDSDWGPTVVTGADDGTLLFYEYHEFRLESYLTLGYELAPPGAQLEPLAVWWGQEDEGAILTAAYRQPDGTVGIYAMDWETYTFESAALLFVDPDRLDEVRVSAREGAIVVVGPVGQSPAQVPTRDKVWAIDSVPEPSPEGRLRRTWREVPLDPRPDAITDVDGFVLEVLVAGRLDNRPLVWEVEGRRIDLPELVLGAGRAVLVADPFWLGDDPAIGLETADGPVLLLPGGGEWEQVELPKGRLDDVVAIRDVRSYEESREGPPEPGDGRLLAIIDGVVWMSTY